YTPDAGYGDRALYSEDGAGSFSFDRGESGRIHPVWDCPDSIGRELEPLEHRVSNAVRDGDDRRDIFQHPAVEGVSGQRQIVMAGQNQFGCLSLFAGEGGDQVITAHVRVHDVDVVAFDDVANGAGRWKVQRIAERQFVPGGYYAGQWVSEGAGGSDGQVKGVTAFGKTSDKASDVDFTAPHLAC